MSSTAVKRQKSVAQLLMPVAPWPHFGTEEIEAATSVLRSGAVNYWTGQEGRLFESEFAASVGAKHAICVANGTLALELALSAMGIGHGDEVITTSRTFIASASCAVMRGARPVCVDVDRETQNITADTVRKAITPRTKVIIPVHLAGWPCNMDELLELASEYGLKVIEDCAQAQGALYKGRPVGSMGHASAFSFCQDKIMTTAGEGGMLVTNDPQVWERAWSFKDHGKNYEAVHTPQHTPGFRWLHDSFGTNWRMTEVQSAIGRVVLKKVPEWVNIRRANASILTEVFSELSGLRVTLPSNDIYHAYYKYYTFVRPERLRAGWNRDRILAELAERGIRCFSGSCSEIYLENAFPEEWRPEQPLPVARELGETSLMFQVHPTLTSSDIYEIAEVVADVMRDATN
jgi:dTDP-4-amino-4,6-dideoxygalactose transaminase